MKQEALTEGLAFGRSIAETVGLIAPKIIVSTEISDFSDRVKQELVATLLGTEPMPSNMRNAEMLWQDLNLCQTVEQQAELEHREMQNQVLKLNQDIKRKKDDISGQDAKKNETRRTWYTFFIGTECARPSCNRKTNCEIKEEVAKLNAQLDNSKQTEEQKQQKKIERAAKTVAMKAQLAALMSSLGS